MRVIHQVEAVFRQNNRLRGPTTDSCFRILWIKMNACEGATIYLKVLQNGEGAAPCMGRRLLVPE